MIAALLLLLAPALAADGPEVTRDIGRAGEVVVLWPRISPMTEDPQILQIAAEAQSVLSQLAQSLDQEPNVRPMPERVCPREKNGCRVPTLSALIAHQDGGCAVIGLVSAAGEAPTEVIGWVGHVQVRERSVAFREAPESIVRIADFAPCDSVLAALPERSDVLTDALRAALVAP